LASPDDGDALIDLTLTFAQPVAALPPEEPEDEADLAAGRFAFGTGGDALRGNGSV